MYWFDELERMRRALRERVRELLSELETSTALFLEEEREPRLDVPLHTLLDLGDRYAVVVDLPLCDSSSVEILVHENGLEIRARLREAVDASALGYRCRASRVSEYVKRIALPPDADPEKARYHLRSSRVFVEIPKKLQIA
ncbi:MAG: Hsp20/alpha crystallin family protein [Fervidicoccaceae archaeon]